MAKAKSLLIVESPAKARTISKYLGPDFEVKASVGHVVDLPPSRLGVSLDHDFQPEYQIIKGKEAVVKELRKAAEKSEEVYLAPDPDREGEAIAWHIAGQLGGDPDRFHRVLFHELTKTAILKAMTEPRHLDARRFESQQARRVLDRLVGYQISPLLWEKVRRGLSAGRVQSVALRLVVERERAVSSFVPQEYWTVTAQLDAEVPPRFPARLAKLNGKKFDPHSEAQALAAVEAIKTQTFLVEKVTTRERRQGPPPPFITSTLQQEAYRKLGLSTKRTMSIAQKLYEGMETPEGQMGLITYMRTDSTRLANEAIEEVRSFIDQRFGAEYVPAKPNYFKARAGAQEAHEAIRPTSCLRTPESLSRFLKKEELGLYRLIWNRFVACQMAPVTHDQTQAEISAGPGILRASGQVLKFKGFTVLYVEDRDEGAKNGNPGADNPENQEGGSGEAPPIITAEGKEGENLLPPLSQGQILHMRELLPRQHFTQPPPHFTEASLVKELEEKGIGRPSTYSAILSTLQDKEYVSKNERKHLISSPLGMVVNDLLVESFPKIMDIDFTAALEQSLDEVEEGKVDWRKLLGDFYGPFAQSLREAKTSMRQIKGKGLPSDVICPQCGKGMSIRLGKHGEFLACDGYPQCKTTFDFTRDADGKVVPLEKEADPGVLCDKCGQPMRIKRGKFGSFLACTAYPQCRGIMPLDQEGKPAAPEEPVLLGEKCPRCGHELIIKNTRQGGKFISCSQYPNCRYSRGFPLGVDCPECGGALVEKRSKRGKIFYGCDNYPKCAYALWDRPEKEACPQCGHPFLVRKASKQGPELRCPAPNCKYKRPDQ